MMLPNHAVARHWAMGQDSAYYEQLARQALYIACRDDDTEAASEAAHNFVNAQKLRNYERGMREAKPKRAKKPAQAAVATPAPYSEFPPAEPKPLTKRQAEIWRRISEDAQRGKPVFLGSLGSHKFFIRPAAGITLSVLQALERAGHIQLLGDCSYGTMFKIAHPHQLPLPGAVGVIDPTW